MHSGLFKQILASFIITLSVLMSGSFFGWPSPVTVMLHSSPINVTDNQESWMVMCIEIGNLLTPLPTGYLMDKLGRQASLMVAAPLAIAGWALIRFTKGVWGLYVARILHGCAMAVAYTVAPVYLGEIAHKDYRTSLGLFFQGMNSSGVLFVYVVGWMVSYDTLAIIMCAIPVLLMTLLTIIPESPYYLLMKEDKKGAIKSLGWLRSSTDDVALEEELKTMEQENKQESTLDDKQGTLLKSCGWQLFLVLVMGTCQIFSGVGALESYASSTFNLDGNRYAIALGLVAVSSDLMSAYIVRLSGQRPLLLISLVGCAISHIVAAYSIKTERENLTVLGALAGVMFFANTGIMPLVTTIVCGYFPTKHRARANGITQLAMTTASLVSLKIFQPINDVYGMHINFVVFAAITACCAVFVYCFIPETNGMEIETIPALFNDDTNGHNGFKGRFVFLKSNNNVENGKVGRDNKGFEDIINGGRVKKISEDGKIGQGGKISEVGKSCCCVTIAPES